MTPDASALLALPGTAVARTSLELVEREESSAVANHSVRSYLFARMFADHLQAKAGVDYDDELLFLACVLHDIGLSEFANGDLRFEVDGANAAAEFLTAQGLPAAGVDAVWEAIALHTSPHIPQHRNVLCRLTASGIGIDVGRRAADYITDAQAAIIHRAYPRHAAVTTIVDTIVDQARTRPDKAPPGTPAAELLRERTQPPYTTYLERWARSGRWGT
ncbi:HD domain-containing protein [Nocardia transvalensis]|uniref:HD domain-containing protein n=1 Tax=Nocardia transvalensis TaxID=37333 RepID=UPI001E4F9968|nr:HD domain-containing protein [Nocardia transvalensis]